MKNINEPGTGACAPLRLLVVHVDSFKLWIHCHSGTDMNFRRERIPLM